MRYASVLSSVGIVAAVIIAMPQHVSTQREPGAQRTPQATADSAGNPEFEKLVDRYVTLVHGTGGGGMAPGRARIPDDDGSVAFREKQIEGNRALLRDLQKIDRRTLAFDQDVDYRYLESLLKSNLIDAEKVKRWQQDPREYLPQGLLLPRGGVNVDQSRPAESATRLLQVMKAAVPRLENGKKNLTQYVPLWAEASRGQLDALIGIFDQDIPHLAERVPDQREALLSEGRKTLQALREFKKFLDDEWPKRPAGDWRIGKEALNARLRDVYMVDDMDADKLYDWGRRGYAEQLKVLEQAAFKADPSKTWQQIEREIQADHPSAENVVYDYLQVTRKARDWVVEKNIASFPGSATDPFANMLLVRLVYGKLGLDPRWGSDRREEYLRGRNMPLAWAMMTHEVYPGHGFLELWAQKNSRKLRQVENQSYSNQAWCYWVEWFLAPEFGFYPVDKRNIIMVEMERNKLWRYVRVINEIGMHIGAVTFDEAVQLLRDGVVWWSQRDAFTEVEATAQGSVRGDAVCTYGYIQYLQLRDDYFAKMGSLGREGSIKDFNDRIMRIGMMPLKLIREAMFHQIDQERQRPTSSP